MTARACPRCRGTGVIEDPDDDAAIKREGAILRAACRDLAIPITPPDLIHQRDAARLIGKSAKTLANWATDSQPIPIKKIGGRNFYSLSDLAAYRLKKPAD